MAEQGGEEGRCPQTRGAVTGCKIHLVKCVQIESAPGWSEVGDAPETGDGIWEGPEVRSLTFPSSYGWCLGTQSWQREL